MKSSCISWAKDFLQTLHYKIDWYSSSRFSKLWVKSSSCIVPETLSSLAGYWLHHWLVNFGNWKYHMHRVIGILNFCGKLVAFRVQNEMKICHTHTKFVPYKWNIAKVHCKYGATAPADKSCPFPALCSVEFVGCVYFPVFCIHLFLREHRQNEAKAIF